MVFYVTMQFQMQMCLQNPLILSREMYICIEIYENS